MEERVMEMESRPVPNLPDPGGESSSGSCSRQDSEKIVEEALKVLERPLHGLDEAFDIECALLRLMDQADGPLEEALFQAIDMVASVSPEHAASMPNSLLTVEQWRERVPALAAAIRAAVPGPDPT
jgi:hypothetical protein